ncbi:hypothetical protein GW17_00035569, partial [Ensete ventricosum]
WKRPLAVAPSRCCITGHYTYTTSLVLVTSLRVSDIVSGGCASTNLTLDMQ